jgi:hypothetical protein
MKLSKEEFMQQFILNRANVNVPGFTGASVAREAEEAWEAIKKALVESV